MSIQLGYASFLVRMWRVVDVAAPGVVAEWHGEIEHIQTSQRLTFTSSAELWEFFRRVLVSGNTRREPADG